MVNHSRNDSKLLLLSLVLWLVWPAARLQADLAKDISNSPDGKLSLHIDWGDDGPKYRIVNRKTGKSTPQIPVGTVVLAVQWTRDSKAVIVVEHLAQCSLARVLSSTHGRWSIDDAYPPGPWIHFGVLDMVSHQDKIAFRYRVDKGTWGTVAICTFIYDVPTGDESHIKVTRISAKAFEALKPIGNPGFHQ